MAFTKRKSRRSGEALVEFTLVGIPLIFILISTAEMARGMWNYQTLAYAIRSGARYATAHGQGCSAGTNSCGIRVSDVARSVAAAAVGLPPASFNIVLTSDSGATVTCAPVSSCFGNTATWPPAGDNTPGKDVRISGTYYFSAALGMLWPGAGAASFSTFTLPAWTRQQIQF
ncbi:MAG: hypothetical protein JWN34_4854 [Bryobacterales bacterium]|nr:hypothetical protein [Bryobacterales bacterium]